MFFIVVLELATWQQEASFNHIALLFVKEAIGGAIYGFIIGYVAYMLLKAVDDYQVEVLITLALVTGGYSLAQYLHI